MKDLVFLMQIVAAALFIRRMSELTSTHRLDREGDHPLLAAQKRL